MYFLALAADFDGTLAKSGSVGVDTIQAIREFRKTGRRLLLVTGRELDDLKRAFPELDLFDRVVAENGAVIYDPATSAVRVIAPAPPSTFIQRLIEQNVHPISIGHSIVATWHPHETTVLQIIHELGLELHIVFNKGAVMVLPANVSKGSGVQAALKELDISPLNVVAVGDGENDQSFFHVCGCAAAVANALTIVSQSADIKLQADHGAGVRELMQRIAYEDSRVLPPSRRGILAGVDWHGEPAYLTVEDAVLIVGNSGAGKSSLAILLTERMAQAGFQFCVIDPEGDYLTLQNAAVIGCSARTPETVSALQLLVQAGINVAINAPTLSQPERQSLFATLIPPIQQLRLRSGRPHWVVLDEAHHVLWAAGRGPGGLLADSPSATVLITLDPALLDLKLLRLIDVIIAVGSTAPDLLLSSAQMLKIPISDRVPIVAHDEALLWSPKSGAPPRAIRLEAPRQSHNRHSGKYAVGDVGADHSFYFRGPQNAVNIRACNLSEFITLSDTIDGAVWTHHLHAYDFSAWFRKTIRDDALAQAAEAIERDQTLDDRESRKRIREAISSRYVIPCGKAAG